MKDAVFLNVGLGLWYTRGTDRLKESLAVHGFDGDVVTWKNHWPGGNFPHDCVYTVKADACEWAMNHGYRIIIWGDCSIYALRSPAPFVNHIREHGYWIGQSGYSAAQTASDAQLAHFDVTRDWAERVPDCASGLFGFNLHHPQASAALRMWIEAGRQGAFHGSRKHDGQSKDPRFQFCRQDQSAMSIVLGKLAMPLGHFRDFAAYKWDRYESVFRCEGM